MSTLDYIGIKAADAGKITKDLNDLLANYQVFYSNVRGFHWNVKGHHFLTLHKMFEELYNSLAEQIDEIAERILTLGGVPQNRFSDYLKTSEIKEEKDVSCGWDCIESILKSFKVVIKKQRKIISSSGDAGDEGTADLLTGFMREQEKLVWMYDAYLEAGSCKVKK